MSKSTLPFNPAEYALVADRITAFYAQHPSGRIITKLVSRDRDVVFRAAIYRSADDRRPAATGWASEREGNGEINMYACVENTETSAIGRALANLGFTASRKRPSREEMQKVERSRYSFDRQTLAGIVGADKAAAPPKPSSAPAAETWYDPKSIPQALKVAEARDDLSLLLDEAVTRGYPAGRAASIRSLIAGEFSDTEGIAKIEGLLRAWLAGKDQRAS